MRARHMRIDPGQHVGRVSTRHPHAAHEWRVKTRPTALTHLKHLGLNGRDVTDITAFHAERQHKGLGAVDILRSPRITPTGNPHAVITRRAATKQSRATLPATTTHRARPSGHPPIFPTTRTTASLRAASTGTPA